MNRERLLFVGVVALVALWFFVLREPAKISPSVGPKNQKHAVIDVRKVVRDPQKLVLPHPYGAFTQVTNEKEHERPALSPVAARDLPGIWPPTSRTVRLALLGFLRHNTVAPIEGEATLQLPAVPGAVEEAAPADGVDAGELPVRIDKWTALGAEHEGKVVRIKFKGKWIKDPGEVPMVGPLEDNDFHRLLAWCQIDQLGAAADGVTELEIQKKQGRIRYPFDKEINNVRAATQGTTKPYWDGLVGYLRLPKVGAGARTKLGEQLLAEGLQGETLDPRLEWALLVLGEARKSTPKNARAQLKKILMLELKAANALFQHETVLNLAFEHLKQYPSEAEVIEIVGNLLASRTFGLLDQAEQWFAKAPRSTSAQLSRVEVLIRLDRFEDARRILEEGRAGAGPLVNLLYARAALALGLFDAAVTRASSYIVGEHAVEANLILGGVDYARGEPAKAAEKFLAALEKDPRNSRAYSDLGLAMAVQGLQADAQVCFERAEKLDFENTVSPALGRLYLQFAAADAAHLKELGIRREMETRKNKAEFDKVLEEVQAAQATALNGASEMVVGDDGLEASNPLDLLVRYFAGYTLERKGELKAAYDKYRSVIDNDHRYRIAIARLGVVLARHLEAEPGDDRAAEFAKAADAHLTKSQLLNPKDPVVPYILGRFHMLRGTKTAKADKMFAIAAELPAPSGDLDLPNWAAAGRAALAYRNPDTDVGPVKAGFANVQRRLRQRIALESPADLEKAVAANPVYAYAAVCLAEITENQQKRVVNYTFRNLPKGGWTVQKRNPMIVAPTRDGMHFEGRIDYKGQEADPFLHNSLKYTSRDVGRETYHEIRVEGGIPAGTGVQFGIGIVRKRRGRGKSVYTGIRVRRNEQSMVELSIDGARQNAALKSASRNATWVITKARWETGPFELRIAVADRDKGTFRIFLKQGDGKMVNLLETGLEIPEETTRLLTRGGGGGPFEFYIWVEGSEGTEYRGILVRGVSLVKSVK
ncbi:MAG: tetratricopeptide repeat protein [Planctomycetota bacterium]